MLVGISRPIYIGRHLTSDSPGEKWVGNFQPKRIRRQLATTFPTIQITRNADHAISNLGY